MAELLTETPSETTPPTETPASPASPPAAAPATPPVPSSAAPDWRATLPDDLKANTSLGKFKDVGALAKSYVQLEQFRGRSLTIPGEDATPEQVREFYQKLGAPDAPEKYEMKAPAGQAFDPGLVKSAQQVFHALGLTPAQAQGLMAYYTGELSNPQPMIDKLRVETTAALKGEWGGAFEYRLAKADGTARELDRKTGAPMLALLKAQGLHVHPTVVKFYDALARDYAEDGDLPSSATGILTPEDAESQIAAIRGDPAHPYHKGDPTARAEMTRLYELAGERMSVPKRV